MGEQANVSRRGFFGFGAAAIGAAVLGGEVLKAPAASAGTLLPPLKGGEAPSGLSFFKNPADAVAPKFRWWWPNGEVEIDEIVREVNEIADAGFKGVEIADVHHGLPDDNLDIEKFPWGGERWKAAVEAALEAGAERGVSIDITLGPSWPASVPGVTPQDEAAMVEIAHGIAELDAGAAFDDALPRPELDAAAGVEKETLIGVHAAILTEIPEKGPHKLDQDSLVDLTDLVEDERLSWEAPEDGETWVILAYWLRGSGLRPEGGKHTDPLPYVVDHFSLVGANAVIDYFNANVITPRMKELFPKSGGAFFEDSLEVDTDATLWTHNIENEFQERMGYELREYFPIILQHNTKYAYDFVDFKNDRVRDDFNQVMSDLYTENHLLPIKEWAHSLDMKYRVQAYGLEQDSVEQAGILDIPETESLGAKNPDDYRVIASGRDMGGKKILSSETGAVFGQGYNSTWTGSSHHDMLHIIGATFAGGVNQTVMHGYPYRTAPGAKWPGFAPFSPYYDDSIGYSEAWGARTPSWKHINDVSGFLSRTQAVLQHGSPEYDVAFLRQKGWTHTGIGAPWATREGVPTGWTHGFLAPSSLKQERAIVKNGRFAPEAGNYKAIIVDIDRFRGREATLDPDTAAKLVEYAKAGLPVVLHGDWSNPESTGLRDEETDAAVADLVQELKGFDNVKPALEDDDIPVALANLGIQPAVSYPHSNLKHVRRIEGNEEFFYFVNVRHGEKDVLELINDDVTITTLSDSSVPYELNAWTGEVSPIARFTRDGKNVRLRVRLNPAQSTIIVLAPRDWEGGQFPSTHVTATDADRVAFDDGKLYVEAFASGEVDATLADGRVKTARIPSLPEAQELTSWKLSVEDWRPGDSDTETDVSYSEHTLDSLVPWTEIDGLEDVSGIGDYSTVFELDHDWAPGLNTILLRLGQVSDTFHVWVNSQRVAAVDMLSDEIDISDYVRPGRNTLRVEVTTTLLNRLRRSNPDVYEKANRAEYGLLGPVQIVPVGRARIA